MTDTPDLVETAQGLIERATAAGLTLRVLGGIAFTLQSRGRTRVGRSGFSDMDFVVPEGSGRDTAAFLTTEGLAPATNFNALRGDRRLLFGADGEGMKVDVFVGAFEMCHAIPVAERLDADPLTVPRPELLMTKLQVVELNAKDVIDIHSLLLSHEVTPGDPSGIDAAVIAELCARDWGLWRTVTGGLERVAADDVTAELTAEERQAVSARAAAIRAAIDDAAKSRKWKLRARVGERSRWYNEPEEI